jgi:hypothetical protein
MQANAAMQHIDILEAKLDDAARNVVPETGEEDPWRGQHTRIEARDIEFRYPSSNGKGNTFRRTRIPSSAGIFTKRSSPI